LIALLLRTRAGVHVDGQPLAASTGSFHMTSTFPVQIKLALASGG